MQLPGTNQAALRREGSEANRACAQREDVEAELRHGLQFTGLEGQKWRPRLGWRDVSGRWGISDEGQQCQGKESWSWGARRGRGRPQFLRP